MSFTALMSKYQAIELMQLNAATQREQLKNVRDNEAILQQMVDNHQLTINGLKDQNMQLGTTNKILLQNHQIATSMSKVSREYNNILDIVCKQFKTFNTILLENEHIMTECMVNASTEYSTIMTLVCQQFKKLHLDAKLVDPHLPT